jgi:iron complex transport system substrate-binding protein
MFKIGNGISFFLLLITVFGSSCKTSTKTQATINAREITDDSNRRVLLPQKVERAISLAPNLTESVFAIDAGERLIGITEYCNFPADETKKIQKVGDTIKPNIETILALKPQVILVSTASQLENFTKQLEENNIAVFITNPTDLDGIFRNLTQLGEIFGKTEKAVELLAQLRKRLASVEAKTSKARDLKVFVQISKEPLYTIGKLSFLNDLINRAGGISVTQSIAEAFPKLSKETALASNPDVIILSESPDNMEANDLFNNSPAAKNKRIYKLNADIISRPTPRLVDALEIIAKHLHPEAFQ